MAKKQFPMKVFVTKEDEGDGSSYLLVRDNEGDQLEVGDTREVAIYELTEVRKIKGTYVTVKSKA